MPWTEKTVEAKRTEFVAEVLQEEKSMSQLCREHGITRKTGYKWVKRAKSGEGLVDKKRGIKNHPNKTAKAVEETILEARREHPAWGARKLKRYLENQGNVGMPAQSTICEILKRNSMVSPEGSESHTPYRRFEREKANELWQMDFKGDFGLLNGQRCYPLTVLDDHSRYSLCLEAKENQQAAGVFNSIGRVFGEYGLPGSVLCDNGSPWGDCKAGSITQFDVWMMQLGVLPIHIRPLRPQTQGKEERFHRTLKEEVLRGEVFADIPSAQRRFESWRHEYNHERPHEALGFETPSKRYAPSRRRMPAVLGEPEYGAGKNLRKVNYKGYVSIQSHRYYLTEALIGKLLEVRTLSDAEIGLYYGRFRISVIRLDERIFSSRRICRDGAEATTADTQATQHT